MQIWHRILEKAIRAPSPHNTQPWRVKILDSRHAVLYMDGRRMLPDEDRTGHFLLCAMGVFLSALDIAAGNAGVSLRFALRDRRPLGPLYEFVDLTLDDSPGGHPQFSDDLLLRRVTSRLGSNGVAIPPELTAALRNFEPGWGYRYHQIDDAVLIERIVQENIRTVFQDLNDRRYHDEIVRWFRYTDREAAEKRDGLDYRCMLVSPAELTMMRRLPQAMQWRLTRRIVWKRYRRQLGDFTHIGIIGGPFFDDLAAIDAGRFLLRFWLELARNNLSIHPFGNLVTNADAYAWARRATGVEDAWLFFRVGYTAAPPRSYRRKLEEVLVND
jgi:nitroreductase